MEMNSSLSNPYRNTHNKQDTPPAEQIVITNSFKRFVSKDYRAKSKDSEQNTAESYFNITL